MLGGRSRGRVDEAVARASGRLVEVAMASPGEVLEARGSDRAGISDREARIRLERYGANTVARERAPAWYTHLLRAVANPFVGVLAILAVASFVTEYLLAPPGEEDLTALVIIGALVLFSAVLSFVQEYQANRAADQLLSMIRRTVTALRRDHGPREMPADELVPGDIVLLSAGDIVPADLRILEANNLALNESSLTGESLPVEKSSEWLPTADPDDLGEYLEAVSALDLDNIGFMGTHVVSGTARTLVLATGDDTYLGAMSGELVGHHPPTSFDRGVADVSLLLLRFMAIMVPVIFLVGGLVRGDWFAALVFGLAVAVGLTPEMLPTIITANLAKGTVEMARGKTIVKRLNAIQNLGAMDVLCTDKTGTLTHDSVAMECALGLDGQPDARVFHHTYLNSSFQTGLNNPLDDAVLAHADAEKMRDVLPDYRKLGEIPFHTVRRRMSVVLEDAAGVHLVTKGAVDEMLEVSERAQTADGIRPLDDALRGDILELAHGMNDRGLRVLLVGHRGLPGDIGEYSPADEKGLTLLGAIGFLDPPKESAGAALEALARGGVGVRVITGDNAVATRRICREIGLEVRGVVEGPTLNGMSDEELRRTVEENDVFVRTAPLQKSRIVSALKANGHTVGFLGDGMNDAPALREADVGISVDNAVEIAKEAAEIILLEKNLLILEEGVARGRRVFGNIMKYIKMTVSSNFGNVFSVLLASILLPFPPMLPLHLLVQNLLYDVSQVSIPWDTVDEEYLERPRRWNPESIARFTLFVGPVSSLFDLSTFALMWFVFGARTVENAPLFHTGWFVLGLLSQTLIVHLIRTRKVPFLESTAAVPVLITTFVVMLVGLALPFTGLGAAIGFVTLPGAYFPWLLLTLVAYCALIQVVKVWYIRRFDMWL